VTTEYDHVEALKKMRVSAFAHAGDEFGARLCAEAMGTEAVHRALR
jgi:hypothetical protein